MIGAKGFLFFKNDDEPYDSQEEILMNERSFETILYSKRGQFQMSKSIQFNGRPMTPIKHYSPKWKLKYNHAANDFETNSKIIFDITICRRI